MTFKMLAVHWLLTATHTNCVHSSQISEKNIVLFMKSLTNPLMNVLPEFLQTSVVAICRH